MLLEERVRERELGFRSHRHRARGREQVIVAARRVVETLQLFQDEVPIEAERADPQEVRIGVLDAGGDGAEIARAEFVLEIEHDLEPVLRRDVARAGRLELRRRELAGHDRDRLRGRRGRGHGIEDDSGYRLVGLGPERRRRELHVVLREMRHAEAMMDEQLLVTLRHPHRGDDASRRVGAHQQVDLVHRDELLVETSRHLGLGLIVEQDPFDGTTEQTVVAVQLLDVDLGGDLVQERGRRERAGERQGAADLDRRARGRRHRPEGECHEEGAGEEARESRSPVREHRLPPLTAGESRAGSVVVAPIGRRHASAGDMRERSRRA